MKIFQFFSGSPSKFQSVKEKKNGNKVIGNWKSAEMAVDVEHLAGDAIRSAGSYSSWTLPLILPLIFIFISLTLLHFYLQSRRIAKIGNKIPGPPTLPIIGNAHYVWNKTHNGNWDLYSRTRTGNWRMKSQLNCEFFI